MELKTLNERELSALYREEMEYDFPQSELKPLGAMLRLLELGQYEPLVVLDKVPSHILKRFIVLFDHSYEPSGALTVEHTSVVVTHNGKTDSVDIRVADPDDFDVIVTHYEGTRMENGKKVSFSESPNIPLSQFTFDTLNITPRTEQTVTMTVSNGTDMDLAAGVFVSDPVISEGLRLAEQLTLTVRSGTGTYTASVADIAAGEVLSLGTIDAGGSVTVTVTLEFPESEHNNEAMGQNVSFGLGVIAGQEAASP